MRILIFAVALSTAVASCIALAQDQPQTVSKPPAHHVTPKPPVHHAAATVATTTTSAKMTATQAQQNPITILQKLQQFTQKDIQAALADAQAQTPPDTVAATCYTELLTVLGTTSANSLLPAVPGVISGFQKARDLSILAATLNSNNGPLNQLNVACAPLVFSTQATIAQLGIVAGLVASGGLVMNEPQLGSSLLAYQQARDKWITAASE